MKNFLLVFARQHCRANNFWTVTNNPLPLLDLKKIIITKEANELKN
jgi:hypothetical protein